jgi:hypothetical protein
MSEDVDRVNCDAIVMNRQTSPPRLFDDKELIDTARSIDEFCPFIISDHVDSLTNSDDVIAIETNDSLISSKDKSPCSKARRVHSQQQMEP